MNSPNLLKIREIVAADSRNFVTIVRRLAPIRLARTLDAPHDSELVTVLRRGFLS